MYTPSLNWGKWGGINEGKERNTTKKENILKKRPPTQRLKGAKSSVQ